MNKMLRPRLFRPISQLALRNYGKAERFMWCQKEIAGNPKVVLKNGLEMPLVGLGTWMVGIILLFLNNSHENLI